MFDKMDFSQMGEMLKKAQESAQKMQEESGKKEFIAKSGGGLVKVTISGKGEVIDLTIDDIALTDKDMLQILLIGAMNDANKMVQQNQQSSAMGMLGGLGGTNPFGTK